LRQRYNFFFEKREKIIWFFEKFILTLQRSKFFYKMKNLNLIDYEKKIVIIGNINAISYKEIFNKMHEK